MEEKKRTRPALKEGKPFTYKQTGKNKWTVYTPEGKERCTVDDEKFARRIAIDNTQDRNIRLDETLYEKKKRNEPKIIHCIELDSFYKSIKQATARTGVSNTCIRADLMGIQKNPRKDRLHFEYVENLSKGVIC